MERAYLVRTSVINATGSQWDMIRKMEVRGAISVELEDFLEVVGLVGGLSAKYNHEERDFFDDLYALERTKR